MGQRTDAQLTTEANVIKNETIEGANTADRVGEMLVNMIDSKLNNADAATDYLAIDGSNANTTIDTGAQSINTKSLHIKGTNGAGHLALKHQNSNITANGNESAIGANSSGNPVWKNDGNTIESIVTNDQLGPIIVGLTEKSNVVNADSLPLSDSENGNASRKITWLSIKFALKAYFDTLYWTVVDATNSVKGIMKLYTDTGSNTDGTMTQSAITTALDTKENSILTDQTIFIDFAFDTSQGSAAHYNPGTQGGAGQAGALVTTTYTNAFGVFRLTSGTTANSGLSLQVNPAQIGTFRPGTYAGTFIGRVNMNQLSNGTERYITRIGLITAAYNANPTSGIFFRYSDNVNSGFYECVCRNGGSETVISTTVAPAISTNWDKLEWRINAGGTSVEFFINNVSQGSLTTNIPTTTYLLIWFVLHKVIGSASQLMDIDYYYFKLTRTL